MGARRSWGGVTVGQIIDELPALDAPVPPASSDPCQAVCDRAPGAATATAGGPGSRSWVGATRSPLITASRRAMEIGSPSTSACQSAGRHVAWAVNAHGSSAMSRPVECTCGRQVAKLYGAGRLFACRHCYRLGYAVQRGGPMDGAHHRLRRLHRKLGADYNGPDGIPPPKPKWMRWRTYSRIASQIEAGEEHLDHIFTVGAQRFLSRIDRLRRRRGI